MKHLHVRFVAAGLGLGIGVLMIALGFWEAWAWSTVGGFSLSGFLVTVMYVGGGLVTFSYSWTEVRSEMIAHQPRL